jgi:hypothetical protein
MSKKWYQYFVSVGDSAAGEAAVPPSDGSPPDSSAPASNAAQAVADIAASLAPQPAPTPAVARSAAANSASFQEIYDAAEIRPPTHGFTIMKVGDMLRSEHIRNLPRDVKRSSVLVALEAAGAPLQDVIEDAVKRDRALDTFERVQEKSVADLEAAKGKENQQIQSEMDRVVADYRARIQANTDTVAKEKERFFAWRLKKQEEEQKISDAVSYFVTENPITAGGPPEARPAAAPAGANTPGK